MLKKIWLTGIVLVVLVAFAGVEKAGADEYSCSGTGWCHNNVTGVSTPFDCARGRSAQDCPAWANQKCDDLGIDSQWDVEAWCSQTVYCTPIGGQVDQGCAVNGCGTGTRRICTCQAAGNYTCVCNPDGSCPQPQPTPTPQGCVPGSCNTSGCSTTCQGQACGNNGCGTCSTGTLFCPTATPPPACVNPPPPTLIAPLTSALPGNVTFSWSNTGAPSYYFRISPNGYGSCSQGNDYCPSPITSTSIVRNLNPGTYTWWVHSVGTRGGVEDWSCYSTAPFATINVVPGCTGYSVSACVNVGGSISATATGVTSGYSVYFPTWDTNMEGGTNQGDIAWPLGTQAGNNWSVTVPQSAHPNGNIWMASYLFTDFPSSTPYNCMGNQLVTVPCPLPTATPTLTPTPVPPTPTPVPCGVTTSPGVLNFVVGGANQTASASVTSGLGGATVTSMAFGSYDTGIATATSPDITSPYQTQVHAVAAGATAVWATATLNDGRTCESTGASDTDVNVVGPSSTPTATPTRTPTPTSTGTPTPTPTLVPCAVTTSPIVCNLLIGGTCAVTASVTSGLAPATVTSMAFGSYNTGLATVSPASDVTSPYSTTVTAVAAGATAVWGTATLSDGRTCQSTGATDTDVNVTAPTSTPTNTPTSTPTRTPTPTATRTPTPTVTPVPSCVVTAPVGPVQVQQNAPGVPVAVQVFPTPAVAQIDLVNFTFPGCTGMTASPNPYDFIPNCGTGPCAGSTSVSAALGASCVSMTTTAVMVGGQTCVDTTGITVLAAANAWWQTRGGDTTAYGLVRSRLPTAAPTPVLIMNDLNSGVPGIVNGNPIDSMVVSQWQVGTPYANGILSKYTYNYFKDRVYAQGLGVTELAGNQTGTAGVLAVQDYLHVSGGNLNLNGWGGGSRKIVILVDNDVTISGAVTGIDYANGGTLVVMAGGDITVDPSVGVTTPPVVNLAGLANGQVQGVYFAGGTFDTGVSSTNQLRVDGTAIGMGGVVLQRSVGSDQYPAEYFNFVPAMVVNMPQGILRRNIRQELLNP